MNPQFETAEDVDREYARRIEAESDAVRRAELRAEAAEQKVKIKEQGLQQRMVAAYRKAAFVDFPKASQFPELVQGNTEEEIMRSAEAAHKRVQDMENAITGGRGVTPMDQMRQQAQDFYGPGPSTGSTGVAPMGYTPPNMAEERWNQNFAQRFNDAPRDAYGQRMGISPTETMRYTNNRFVNHVKGALRYWAMLTRSDAGRRFG